MWLCAFDLYSYILLIHWIWFLLECAIHVSVSSISWSLLLGWCAFGLYSYIFSRIYFETSVASVCLLTPGLNFQLKSWAFGVYSHTLFSNMVLNKFCFGVSNILELSIVLVCLRPIFLQSFSVIVIKRFLNNNCWNNSCFGVLNKLKFSMTSVCLRPIFLNFFTNLLLNIFVSVSPSDYFLISSIWFLKFLPVFWIFNVMREVLLSSFKVCLIVALSMSCWCVKHLQGNFMPELCFTRCSKAASLTDWVKEFFMGCNVGFPK